ncbi:hypothetical protein BDR26DRAFT_831276 [Obelidium mucronatum]|nr:hypothetical protein BDR26DRAFT_831276 [Obelidium mucronatum]
MSDANRHALFFTPLLGPRRHAEQIGTVDSVKAVWTHNELVNKFGVVVLPLALLASAFDVSYGAIFTLNFCAVIPLASVMNFATDQLSMKTGDALASILHVSFGNFVELCLAILALNDDMFYLTRAFVFGSIITNLLLVLGLSFLVGGIVPFEKNKYQEFDVDNVNVSTGLLSLTFMGFLIPAALNFEFPDKEVQVGVLYCSRVVAVILLLTYGAYLTFNFYTNPHGLRVNPSTRSNENNEGRNLLNRTSSLNELGEVRTISSPVAILALLFSSGFIVICCGEIVQTISGLSVETGIPDTFIATILLPILMNAGGHVTAISSALRDRMDFCIRTVIGSSHQVALLIAPLAVCIAWAMDKNLDLNFGIFPTAIMLVTVLVVNAVVADGRSHWFQGLLLIGGHLLVSIGFFFTNDPSKG